MGDAEYRPPDDAGDPIQPLLLGGRRLCPEPRAMLTGKYTIHCGVSRNDDDLPDAEVTIAEALKVGVPHPPCSASGTTAARATRGRNMSPMDQGFDEFFGFTDATHAWEKFPKMLFESASTCPACRRLRRRPLHRPRPSTSSNGPRINPSSCVAPDLRAFQHRSGPLVEIERNAAPAVPEADPANPVNTTYASQVTRLDREVGRVMAALEELGLANDTLVVFTSDHGATFETGNRGASVALDSNRPFRGQKRTLWEGAFAYRRSRSGPARSPRAR